VKPDLVVYGGASRKSFAQSSTAVRDFQRRESGKTDTTSGNRHERNLVSRELQLITREFVWLSKIFIACLMYYEYIDYP
jgi:hypothetical protein